MSASHARSNHPFDSRTEHPRTSSMRVLDSPRVLCVCLVSQMMRSWTEQMGHPLATIAEETWEGTSCTLELRQSW